MDNNKALEKMKEYMSLKGFAPSTQKNYIINIKMFARHFKNPLKKLQPEDAQEFLYGLVSKNCSNAYLITIYASIKFLYRYVFNKRYFMSNIPTMKKKSKLPQVLSIDEIIKIIKSASNLKHKAILSVIYSSGLRLSEAAKLKISDIDSKNMKIFIDQSKNNKDRYTILAKITLNILREYYKKYRPKDWLFNGRYSSKPISAKSIQAAFKKALKQSQIGKSATVHTLRHSFATHSIDNGTHLLALKEIMGHSSLKTTSVYLHISATRFSNVTSPLDMRGDVFDA
jgi:integrase/recombinase XerD